MGREKKFHQWIFVVLCCLLMAGCAGVGQTLEAPRVTLANILVKEIRVLETAFLVELRVYNTNDRAIRVRGLVCDLELMGQHFGTGVSDADVEVPAFDSAIFPVTVYTSMLDLVSAIRNLPSRKEIHYKLTGSLKVEGGFLVPSSLPIRSEGKIALEPSA